MSNAHPPMPDTQRLQAVDLVRSTAILTVMAAHLGCHFITTRSNPYFLAYLWYKLWANGGYGVSMFFVVSGFVITRVIASGREGLFKPDLRDFYARRAGRILPLLAFCCLIGILFLAFAAPKGPAFDYCFAHPGLTLDWSFWASIAAFCFNWRQIWEEVVRHIPAAFGAHWDVLWSLSIEEQFYFFYPLALRHLGKTRNLALFLGAFILLGPLCLAADNAYFPRVGSMNRNSFASFNLIAMGCLLYLAMERFRGYLVRDRRKCLWLCGAGAFLVAATFWHVNVRVDFWWPILGTSAIGLGTACFLLGALNLDFFERPFWGWLGSIGKWSYGGYLYHISILYLLWNLFAGKNEYLAFVLFALATFTVAWLSFRLFEMPANRWIRRKLGTGRW